MTKFTKMKDRDDQEIRATIEVAKNECQAIGFDFWKICAGVDAYFEQRRRKESHQAYGEVKEEPVDRSSPAWGDPPGTNEARET